MDRVDRLASRANRSLRILSYFCAALLCFVAHASAQTPGGIDASFHPLAPESESWTKLATQADGKVLALARPSSRESQLTVYRFNRDGQPDNSFSGDGKVTVDMLVGSMGKGHIVVDPVGRIYIGGGSISGRRTNNAVEVNQYSAWYAIARLLPDGRLDASFGVNGIFRYTLETDDGVPDPYGAAIPSFFTLMPNGNLLLMGQSVWNQLAQMYQGARYPLVFARLDERGRLDSRYGANAVKTTSLNAFVFANAMYMLNDGSLIVTVREPGAGDDIVKLDSQLDVDPSFGQNGRVRLSFYTNVISERSMAVLPDGFVFVGARSLPNDRYQPAAFKLTANGAFDPSFGSGGFSFPPVNAASAFFVDVAVEPGGKILAAGTITIDANSTSAQEPFLVRLLGNGQVDGSFQQTDIPGFANANADLDVTQEGAFLLAFESINPYISTIRKFYIDPAPRTGSLSTGQTQSFSGFNVDVLNMAGVPVDSASTSHLLGLHGYIYTQPSDRGANADVFVVASTARGLYMRTTSGTFVPWNGQVSALVPAHEDVQLTERTYVPIYGGALPFAGTYAIYLGYMRDGSGPLVYIEEPAVLEIRQ